MSKLESIRLRGAAAYDPPLVWRGQDDTDPANLVDPADNGEPPAVPPVVRRPVAEPPVTRRPSVERDPAADETKPDALARASYGRPPRPGDLAFEAADQMDHAARQAYGRS